MGQAVPLVRPSLICPEIHGESGLDCSDSFSVYLHNTSHEIQPVCQKAVIFTYDTIMKSLQSDEKITLIATGCLTNYAILFTVYPELKERVEQLVLLGGAIVCSHFEFSITN